MSADSEFEVKEKGQPVILCHYPKGKGFCNYRGVPGEPHSNAFPYFQYAVPFHEVEFEQYLEVLEPDRNKPEKRKQSD